MRRNTQYGKANFLGFLANKWLHLSTFILAEYGKNVNNCRIITPLCHSEQSEEPKSPQYSPPQPVPSQAQDDARIEETGKQKT
jgi:hypothetical protein